MATVADLTAAVNHEHYERWDRVEQLRRLCEFHKDAKTRPRSLPPSIKWLT